MQDIQFRYEKKWVLDRISCEIEEGVFLGLIGPNGSGKTTLLKMLSGLIAPQSGTRLYRHQPLGSWSRKSLSREIAYVPQEHHFLYAFSVMDVVLMGRTPYTSKFGFDQPVDIRIARDCLDRVGMTEMAERPIQLLSGGERQLVMIARAMAQQPRLLLLDEPTAFLDLSHQIQIYDFLKKLNLDDGVSIIAVSHDLNLAALYCQSLMVMRGGRIQAMGSPSEVMTESLMRAVYGCRTLVDRHPITSAPRITLVPGSVAYD